MLVVVVLLMIASLFLGGPEWILTGGMALFSLGGVWAGYDLQSHQKAERQKAEAVRERPAVG